MLHRYFFKSIALVDTIVFSSEFKDFHKHVECRLNIFIKIRSMNDN